MSKEFFTVEGVASIEEAYAIVKKRYDDINATGGVETFDAAIIPLIKYLNGLKGVATAFCCEGHFVGGEGREVTQGYVIMAVTGEGATQLNILMRRLVLGLPQRLKMEVELASKARGIPVGRNRHVYMAQILRMTFRSQELKDEFYKTTYELLGI